jgi:hypothetical protein
VTVKELCEEWERERGVVVYWQAVGGELGQSDAAYIMDGMDSPS